MANIQLFEGKRDVATALDGVEAQIFGYRLNRLGFGSVVGIGLLMAAGAALAAWQTGLDEPLWTAVVVGLGAGALFLFARAAYWYAFAKSHFVAITDERLFVGRLDKAWAISWSILDAESLGFDDMDASALRGALDMQIAGEQIEVYLYNAFIFLNDIQAFMLSLLKELKGEEGEQTAAESSE
ncbi:MAG: hypothetical protein ACOCV2_07560 [Persicimonas sp.]